MEWECHRSCSGPTRCWANPVRHGPSCPSALSVTWQTLRSLWRWPTTWLLITPLLLPVRADPNGAGEAWSYATERVSACVCVCTYSWLAGKLGMFAEARRACAEERPCDDEVSHYPYGWRCRLKCVHLDVHLIGIYLRSVFGFEPNFLCFYFFHFLRLTGLPVFSNIPLVFLGKTCAVHSSGFPHQPATINAISLQRLSVTSCVWRLARELIFGSWARPSRVRDDTLLVWAERLKPSLCLRNTWCWSWVRLSPALAAIEGQRERIALFLHLITM